MSLKPSDVAYLAHLARLQVDPAEMPGVVDKLTRIGDNQSALIFIDAELGKRVLTPGTSTAAPTSPAPAAV